MDPSRLEMNPYQYGASNPVMYTDPSGLMTDEICRWPKCRWDEYPELKAMAPAMLYYAKKWNVIYDENGNPDYNTGVTDIEFAAIMAATIRREAVLRTQYDQNTNEPWDEVWKERHRVGLYLFLFNERNATMGIANLSPQVVGEIFRGEVPRADGSIISFEINGRLDTYTQQGVLETFLAGCSTFGQRKYLYDTLFAPYASSVDLLAANQLRGIIRAKDLGLTPSVFNLATWHNKGVQGITQINNLQNTNSGNAQEAIDHGNAVVRATFQILEGPYNLFPERHVREIPYCNASEEPLIRDSVKRLIEASR